MEVTWKYCTVLHSYAANAGTGNTCKAGEPITDIAECEAAAAFLASSSFPGYAYRLDSAPPNGEISIDYAAGGCVVYDGAETEYPGLFMITMSTNDYSETHLFMSMITTQSIYS